MLSLNTLIPFILLMALILAACLHGLAASGHFPRGAKAPGTIMLFGSLTLVVIGLIAGIVAALRFVPWSAAIIGGGLSVIGAPLVLQWFPDRFVDGNGALVGFAGTSAFLAILLIIFAAIA